MLPSLRQHLSRRDPRQQTVSVDFVQKRRKPFLRKGFLYLVAMTGWFSREGLARRTQWMIDFCFTALEEAIARFDRPKIFNTDRGLKFTSERF